MKKYLKENLYFKYVIIAVISLIVDLFLFSVFNYLLENKVVYAIIISSYLARIISSLVNYYLNKHVVFKYDKQNNKDTTLFKYFGLVVINIRISGLMVELIHAVFPIYATFIKLVVDLGIFVLNFLIQKYWIFKRP